MKKLKIIMATMGLDLGGAETHIVELACALKVSGHEVVVCSAGGAYTERIEKEGIKHINAPLNVRGVFPMIKAFFILLWAVLRLKPDILHAHARIPAFICAAVSFLTRVRMVTTAHFNFKTDGALKFFSKWGRVSIAVSEDLKSYLIENYGLAEERIVVTVNGINTELFSNRADTAVLEAEFNLPAQTKWIVSVSRMDDNSCLAAFKLLECAKSILQKHSDMHIFLVGNGNALPEIKEIAKRVNRELGYDGVTVTGGRMDIAAFCARADVFVGVSRAALEAMSCGAPVVFAGNQGFGGLLDRLDLDECIATNFTFRGIGKTTSEGISAEIERLLAMSGQERAAICEKQRRIIEEGYSVERMAKDALTAYSIALKRGYDCLICGYYGYRNSGDDALLETIVRNLKAQDRHIKIAALLRGGFAEGPKGIKKFNRFNPFSLVFSIWRSRVVIFGGGNLIQDETSTQSLMYYLGVLSFAQRCGRKTMLYANGIGPISNKNRRMTASVLNRVDVITLREKASLFLLGEMGVTSPDIKVTADEVFTIERQQKTPDFEFEKGYAAVSLRPWKASDPRLSEKLADFLNQLYEKHGIKSVLLPFQKEVDEKICREVAEKTGSILPEDTSLESLVGITQGARLCVGMRLHLLIFAASGGVPSIGIVYDPKVKGFIEHIGVGASIPCESIEPEALMAAAEKILSDEENLKSRLAESARAMKAAALDNAKMAAELIRRAKD